jgi:hypothetical protein
LAARLQVQALRKRYSDAKELKIKEVVSSKDND